MARARDFFLESVFVLFFVLFLFFSFFSLSHSFPIFSRRDHANVIDEIKARILAAARCAALLSPSKAPDVAFATDKA